MEEESVSEILASLNEFVAQPNMPDIVQLATSIFEYTQFLLDKDENLTKTGNLTSSAIEKLEKRIIELMSLNDQEEE